MSTPDCDCGTAPGGFHAFHCARYAAVEDNWTREMSPRDGDDPGHSCGAVDDALPRLKALLADTKAMVAQAEALAASMRDPASHFRKY